MLSKSQLEQSDHSDFHASYVILVGTRYEPSFIFRDAVLYGLDMLARVTTGDRLTPRAECSLVPTLFIVQINSRQLPKSRTSPDADKPLLRVVASVH
jgi:hypothetical protein